jgi:hypothetical protein
MKAIKTYNLILAAAVLTFSVCDIAAASFGTSFVYQGRLTEGTNKADGTYDLIFSLYESDTSPNSLAGPLTNSLVTVTNGLFKTKLDFGAGMLIGTNAWLELRIRTNGGGPFTTLLPRQNLTPAPYSIRAAYADSLDGILPVCALAGSYTNALTFNNAANGFSGNGAGLTKVNADTLGSLPASAFWQVGGNVGTTDGMDFLGTTDNQPLEVKVNGQRAFRFEPTMDSPNLIGGFSGNYVSSGVLGATISGGGSSGTPNLIYGSLYADGSYATIGGGSGNEVGGEYATICGGSSNTIIVGSSASTIGGGSVNWIYGSDATVAGGTGNSIDLSSATIGGGTYNRIYDSYRGTIAGGESNHIAESILGSIVGGGENFVAVTGSATIGGGSGNQIAQSECATIGGGYYNTILSVPYGEDSTISGGSSNTIHFSSASTIGGGSDNQIGGSDATIAGGSENRVSAAGATVGGGQANSAARPYATIPGGTQAYASSYGQVAYASGAFAQPGDAQTSVYVLRGYTTNAIESELFLDGLSERMSVPTNTTWGYDILITGRTTGGVSAFYVIRGMVENNGGTIALIGTPIKDFTREDVSSWDTFVDVDKPSQSLVVRAMGSTGTHIRWVASVRTVEVTY